MIETNIILLFIAGVFLVGFFGNYFFRKTKISDIFFLILIGFLLGPGLKIIPADALNLLKSFSPFFGALALMMLLFDGGLYLNFYKVLKELKNSTVFTILVFILTVMFISLALFLLFKIPIIYGLLIGSIIGGTSSTVLMPLINGSSAKEETKTLLTLEAALTDSLCVVFAIAILDIIISRITNVQIIAQNVFSTYTIAIVLGAFAGFLWINVLKKFTYAKEFGYMLTFSFLIILYIVTDFLKGNGTICILIFGIVLGNYQELSRSFNFGKKDNRCDDEEESDDGVFNVTESIKKFQSEFSLFIKSFFFIYLGIIVDLSGLTLKIFFITLILLLVVILTRILVVKIFYKRKESMIKDRHYLIGLHARGLSAAVLATFPLSMGLNNEITQIIVPVAFMFIILTNLTTTIMLFITEYNQGKLNFFKKKI